MIFCDLAKNLNQIVGIFINLFILKFDLSETIAM